MAITAEINNKRPEDCVFAFGHMFYCLDSTIYFSQLLDLGSYDKIGKCHSINDPTAETFNTPLDTDGGTINIAEATRIYKLERMGPGIVAFAKNGVWYIGGPTSGWKPTSFTVDRVTENGLAGQDTVVIAENGIYYWSPNGIHKLALNDLNIPAEQSITDTTIKSFYQALPGGTKIDCTGNYDSVNKQIGWVYYPNLNDFGQISIPNPGYNVRADRMTHELIYDLRLNAFYPQRFESFTQQNVAPAFFSMSHAFELDIPSSQSRKHYLRVEGGLTDGSTVKVGFCTYSDNSFSDGGGEGGLFPSYIETAYEALGNPSNKKSAPSIMTFFKKTETAFVSDGEGGATFDFPSGCFLTTKWDWNITVGGNKWAAPQQVYRFKRLFLGDIGDTFDDGESVVVTRTSLRGNGRALSLRLEAEEGKDMQVLGFSVNYQTKGRF